MIKPGELRYTLDQLENIFSSSEKISYILQECIDNSLNNAELRFQDFRYTSMIGGFKLSQKSFWDSANSYSSFNLQIAVNMVSLVKKQYGISLDQFLEEQFLDFSEFIYEKMPEFKIENPTSRLGNKRATWSDIDVNINELQNSKYSNIRMTWGFIGARN